jgi:hypothetical protein
LSQHNCLMEQQHSGEKHQETKYSHTTDMWIYVGYSHSMPQPQYKQSANMLTHFYRILTNFQAFHPVIPMR